jgi:glycosyltransferase involved in cell wall biosynthesis
MKVLLEAPILTQSGYGEHSRLVFRALEQSGVEIYTSPLGWGRTSWITNFNGERARIEKTINKFFHANEEARQGKDISFDMQIHVGIPNEFEKKAEYSICVTAGIETDRVSSSWILKTNEGIDKLIVPSSHARSSFVKTAYEVLTKDNEVKTVIECACPVDVVPYPVKSIKPAHVDFKMDTEFNFLSVALLGHRKNMHNMIQWFVEEFKNENVGLVIKTGSSTGSKLDREHTKKVIKNIVSRCDKNRLCKIYLLHGDLTEEQIHSLYVREDIHAYVSTSHGEGYGLPLFEAAYSGMPIVATDWSGHLDFLTAEIKEKKKIKTKKLFAEVEYDLKEISKDVVWEDILIEGARWAHPRRESYKKQLRSVYANYGLHQNRAKLLKNSVLDKFSKEKVYEQMRSAIFTKIPAPSEEVMVM